MITARRRETVWTSTLIAYGKLRREIAFVDDVSRKPHAAVRTRQVDDGAYAGNLYLYARHCELVLAACDAIKVGTRGRKTIGAAPFQDRYLHVAVDCPADRGPALFIQQRAEDGAPFGRELIFVSYELEGLENAAREVLAASNGVTHDESQS